MMDSLQFDLGRELSLRDAFAKVAEAIGKDDERLIMLDADLSKSTKTAAFARQFPQRAFNIGIAEQNMVGIAAGFATMGFTPFVNTFASFLTRRACDQIAISVAYPRLNVKFFGFHGGINLGEDGATQQSVEDFSIMRGIPNISVYSPICPNDLVLIVRHILAHDGPSYVRLARFPSPVLVPAEKQVPEYSGYRVFAPGSGPDCQDRRPDLVILTTGTLTASILQLQEQLFREQNLAASIIAVSQLKPFPQGALREILGLLAAQPASASSVPLVSVEEHSIHGGLADAASASLDQSGTAHHIHRIGINDRFGESGAPRELLEFFGLAGEPLRKKLLSICQK